MPHDKKGRPVEVGDHLKFEVSEYDGDGWKKRATIGRAMTVTPGTETCNVSAAHLVPGYYPLQQACITARDTELVLKADGSEPADAHEAPAAGDAGDPTVSGFGRIGALVGAALIALVALAVPALVADPAPAKTCKATSDIPQFQVPEFQRVCGLHIRTVTLNGSHELAVYTISDDRNYSGHPIAGTDFSKALVAAAQDAHGRLYDLFPMERFEYRLRDAKDRPICAFRFIGQNSAPVAGWCLDHVED